MTTFTDLLDSVFYLLFGIIDELFLPIVGILIGLVMVGVLLWVSGHAKK